MIRNNPTKMTASLSLDIQHRLVTTNLLNLINDFFGTNFVLIVVNFRLSFNKINLNISNSGTILLEGFEQKDTASTMDLRNRESLNHLTSSSKMILPVYMPIEHINRSLPLGCAGILIVRVPVSGKISWMFSEGTTNARLQLKVWLVVKTSFVGVLARAFRRFG